MKSRRTTRFFPRALLVTIGLASAITFAQPPAALATTNPAAVAPKSPALSPDAAQGDFDFLVGAWTTAQRRLKALGVGSTQWRDSPPNVHCARRYLDGGAIVEESYSPSGHITGLFLYLFDVDKHLWSLYWIDPKVGKLDSPLVGRFEGAHGEFFGDDVEDGRPIKVRYSWTKKDPDHALWAQAFSFDGKTWETNWTTEFTRAGTDSRCAAAR